jgi:hypothetical protein
MGVVVALLIALPDPALAQAWIGEMAADRYVQGQIHACKMGVPLPPKEIAEARDPAIVAMRDYWRTVRGPAPADVRSLFWTNDNIFWKSGTRILKGRAALTALDDPHAREAVTLDEAPANFVRAGYRADALGVWIVRDAAGAPLGSYLVDLGRQGGKWKLFSLDYHPAREGIPVVKQFCMTLGDVEAYQKENEERMAKAAERRARKVAERKARAR